MNRLDTLSLLQSSLTARRADYARMVAKTWLEHSPNDLAMKFFLARAHQIENARDDAIQILDQIVAVDLEHAAAQRLIGDLKREAAAHAVAHALDGQPFPSNFHPPHWIDTLRRANAALHIKQFESARKFAQAAMEYDDAPPLASLILLKSHWLAGQLDLALPLAQGFHARWTQSVAILLCLAECLLSKTSEFLPAPLRFGALRENSEVSTNAVELLYTTSTLDPACDVVNRYWSPSHPYRNLWNHDLDVPLPAPIPFEVTKLLGKNQIEGSRETRKQGKGWSPQPPLSEPKIEHTVTLKSNQVKVNHARFYRRPVHVILYSSKLLKAKFGEAASAEVIGLVEQLAAITAKHRRVPVKIIAPDDPVCLARYGLTPVEPTNAWAIKNLLRDVDRWLTRKGQAINSLAIIGGDDLIPFHRLPNPTDDSDDDIPSDNPYGCIDENYFVPEWSVGRLPSPCGRDPEPLKRLLRNTINAHASTSSKFVLMDWVRNILRMSKTQPAPQAIGYAASVWKEAALEVFTPIGTPTQLFTSPPLEADTAPSTRKFDLSYFNLHGVEDSSEWYGQRDPGDEGYGALYPVALTPSDVANGNGQPPRIIFTESCYGANIIGKSEPDAAMCLRFLNDGARALIGSTKIAYGSVGSPLIGADLLARSFWEALLGGLSVGESLRRAKLDLAQTMHKRQNFLDGEDQKTLISFVLYGDPLLPAPTSSRAMSSAKTLPELKTMAMEYQTISDPEIKPEVVAEMKTFLSRYLPGSESANIHLSQPLSPIMAKGNTTPTHRVYTVAKTIRVNSHSIQSYARVTVNKGGKVVKLAVSK